MSHPTQTKDWKSILIRSQIQCVEHTSNDGRYFLIKIENYRHVVKIADLSMCENLYVEDLREILKVLPKGITHLHIEPNIDKDVLPDKTSIIDGKPVIPSFYHNYYHYTSRIDLELDEGQIYSNFSSSNKNNYNKAKKVYTLETNAESNAIELNLVEKFFDSYSSSKNQSFKGHELEFFVNLAKSASRSFIFNVLNDTKVICSAWLIVSGNTAYYIYGGKMKFEPVKGSSVFLHFEIMKFLKSLNVKYYDLCGIIGRDLTPDPTWDGFTKFKLSLGGSEEQLDRGVDIILNKRKYLFFKLTRSIAKLAKRNSNL